MRPFLIWFQHRSGSSHLVSLLNSHPRIHCKGEMFGCFPVADAGSNPPVANTVTFGDKIYRRVINQFPGRVVDPDDSRCARELEEFFFAVSGTGDSRIRGFKFKFPSQAKIFPLVKRTITDRAQEVNLVVLNRSDYLRRAISVLNLERLQKQTGQANVGQVVELPPARFDPDEVVRLIEYYRSIQNEFDNWSASFPNCFSVDYEQLSDSEILQRLQIFLGLEPQELVSSIQKITPDDLRIHVTNLAEIEAAIKSATG